MISVNNKFAKSRTSRGDYDVFRTGGPLLSLGELAAIYFAVVILSAFLRYWVFRGVVASYLPVRYLTFVSLEAAIIGVLLWLSRVKPTVFQAMSFTLTARQAGLAGIIGITGANISALLLHPPLARPEQLSSFSLFALVVLGPSIEELLFRGVFLESLYRQFSPPIAVLTSSVIFATFHTSFGVGMIGGICLGIVYVATRRSLSASLLAHVTTNLILSYPLSSLLIAHYRP